jgi:hypothetical protein
LNAGLHACKAGGLLLLEPHTCSPFLLWLFGDLGVGGSHELTVWAGLELLSSQSQLPN